MLSDGQEAGFMVIENVMSTVCVPAPQLSVARIVKLNVPVAVGVPEMSPAELIFIPGGNEPPIRLKVTGGCPPVVLTWYEYA
jgi:hypothetical protein